MPLVLGLTGIFLVFEYPLDHLFNAHVAYVQPAPSAKAQRVTLDAVATVATQTMPGARLTQINMPGSGGIYRAWVN